VELELELLHLDGLVDIYLPRYLPTGLQDLKIPPATSRRLASRPRTDYAAEIIAPSSPPRVCFRDLLAYFVEQNIMEIISWMAISAGRNTYVGRDPTEG